MDRRGIVFNIQRYSVNDGEGIRTLVFLKGCPLRCIWCSNPESQIVDPQIMYKPIRCIGCGQCVGVCPEKAKPEEKPGNHLCKMCNQCIRYCPTEALEVTAKEMTIEQVIKEIEKDRKFYEISGGGVTISGGEPLMQYEFTANLVEELKLRYYHVAVETCGYAPWEHAERALNLCDLILYDIKHMDSKKHKLFTGVGNELILENAKKIAKKKLNMVFRVPLLGGINDDTENITELAEFSRKLGIEEVHLLPYHRFGESKYKSLNIEYICKATTPNNESINELKEILESRGIKVKVGG